MSALETKRRQRTAAEWIAATIAVVAYIGNCAAFVVHAAAHCTSAADCPAAFFAWARFTIAFVLGALVCLLLYATEEDADECSARKAAPGEEVRP